MNNDLSYLPFWDKLTSKQKKEIENNTLIHTYKKGTYFAGYQDECLGVIYVVKGSIRVFITSKEGREITLFHIVKGETCILSASCVIGELSIDPQMSADMDTTVISINSACYQRIMNENIYVKCFTYELTTKRFSQVLWVMQEIIFKGIDQRMARFLLDKYKETNDKVIKMSQEQIAEEVNTAREVVTRMLKRFSGDKLISTGRDYIKLVNIDGLKNILK